MVYHLPAASGASSKEALMPVDESLGSPAPPLVLPDDTGTTVSLADFRGRPVLLSFLSHAA
jgi:cytochrome oxidase Cu insertion factor (SCO1/SenC/PrrC family)